MAATPAQSAVDPRSSRGAPALELRGITKRYPGVVALRSISLTLKSREVLGLVGENGAGKSTLLSVINGTVRPDLGEITIGGERVRFGHPAEAARHGVATVFQDQGLVPTLAVYENLFLGREKKFSVAGVLRRRELIARARDVLGELGIDVSPTRYTASLSFAQRQLVEIARAFALTRVYSVEPVILLDEPTSALSDRETEMLFSSVRRWRERASFIFVSHRLGEVLSLSDRLAVLKDGELLARLSAGESDEASLHYLMVGRKRDADYYQESRQRPPEDRVLLSVSGLTREGLFTDVSFDLRAGEILGVAGVLGSGKSELARALVGADRLDNGTVALDGQRLPRGSLSHAMAAGIGFVPAERAAEGVIGTHSIEWNLTLTLLNMMRYPHTPILNSRRSRLVTNEWISRLRIRASGSGAFCGQLSGGNQQKVVFAKWLARDLKVLILDDPSRGVDVGAKEEMYRLLRDLADQRIGIVLVSDNLPELIGLATRILVLRDGHVTALIDAPAEAKPHEAEIVREMV